MSILDNLTSSHQEALDRTAALHGWTVARRCGLSTSTSDMISETAGRAVIRLLQSWDDQRKHSTTTPARRRPSVLREIPLTRKA